MAFITDLWPVGVLSGTADSFAAFLCRCDPDMRKRYEFLLRRLLCVCLSATAADDAMQETKLLVCLTDSETWHSGGYAKLEASCLCWGFLSALSTDRGHLFELVARRCERIAAQPEEMRATHTASLVSILGLALRCFALMLPEGPAYDQSACYHKFFITV